MTVEELDEGIDKAVKSFEKIDGVETEVRRTAGRAGHSQL